MPGQFDAVRQLNAVNPIQPLGNLGRCQLKLILWLFIGLYGALGLIHNLKHPKLDWTNEAYAVKQDFGVMLVILEGWAMAFAVMALAGFGTMAGFEAIGSAVAVVIIGGLLWICVRWLRTRGCDRLKYLS